MGAEKSGAKYEKVDGNAVVTVRDSADMMMTEMETSEWITLTLTALVGVKWKVPVYPCS